MNDRYISGSEAAILYQELMSEHREKHNEVTRRYGGINTAIEATEASIVDVRQELSTVAGGLPEDLRAAARAAETAIQGLRKVFDLYQNPSRL